MKRKKVKTIDISKPIQVTNENLGSIFKSLRMEKDYTQEALALELGVSSLTVRKWEWGVSKPPIPYFLNLLDFYDYKIMLVKGEAYGVEAITRGNCMLCGKKLTEGLFFCKECETKGEGRRYDTDR